ncbi:zinc finger protein 84-like, partial [Penaeus monodon]|uniref:zinc finger protein 84-like n=1 Tax=Penaeus monodon TaxID=6687 RepID=UPI0018A7909E
MSMGITGEKPSFFKFQDDILREELLGMDVVLNQCQVAIMDGEVPKYSDLCTKQCIGKVSLPRDALALLTDEEIYGIGVSIKEKLNEDVTKETYLDIKEDPFDYTDKGGMNVSKVKTWIFKSSDFTDTCSISRHMKAHTKKKPYNRKICNKTFSGKGHLMDHIRVHTEEKPYN